MQMNTEVSRRLQGAINLMGTGSKATRNLKIWSPILRAAVVLCIAVLMFGVRANAQAAGSGSIQGVITDPSGAIIPDAAVTITDQATQVKLTTKTNSAGSYAFPNIHIGTYALVVVAPGFQTYTSTDNVLEVGSSIALNEKLTVGSTDTKIVVHAEGLALQTEDATFKQTIDRNEILELPLNGRHMADLVIGVGGSNNNSNPGDTNGSKFPTQSSGISIAGAQGNAISWRLDGGDNNEWMGGSNAPLPFPDAVGQFSVETAAMGAQAGVHIGGLVNIVTQSGTNTYHGSIFEFGRRTRFDADHFFSTSHDSLHQDQYGGTFGGHIIRDRLFAFAAFQHQYSNAKAADKFAWVPTADNLRGDFSVTDPVPVSSGTQPVSACNQPALQLSDPISGQILVGNKYAVAPIWNAASLALQKQLPAINPAYDTGNCGAVTYSIPVQNSENQFDTRVDFTINQKNTLYARYFLDSQQIPAFYSPTNILVTTQSGNPEIRFQSITIGENYVISSNIVNSAHLTATRRQLTRGFNPSTPNAGVFGVKDFQAVPAGIWIGATSGNNNHGFNIGGGSNLLAVIDDNVPVSFNDDVTWIHGRHQFAFGGSILRNQLNVNNGYESDGQFTFTGIYSGANAGGPGKSKVADSNLDFLEGAMPSFNQSLPQTNALRGFVTTLYVQDTFHATPRLTLTAGLNWEPQFFPYDVHHHGAVFNHDAFLANQHSSIYPGAPAGLMFYGDPGVSANFTKNSPWQFNPNFAVSYDVSGNGKTVVRAGAAYAYDEPNFFSQQRVQQNPPFSVLTQPNTQAQLCFSDPWLIGGNTNGGLTQGCAQTGGTDADPFPFNPQSFTFPQQAQIIVPPATYKSPNTFQWTASIQHQFPHGWNGQIFYTGSRTQHQLASYPLNPAVYIPGVWTASSTNNYGCPGVATTGPAAVAAKTLNGGPAGTPCSVNNINKTSSIPNNQQARYKLTAENPAQGNYYAGNGSSAGSSLYGANNASANYNGVIVTVQHRFSTAFSILANYTWSKCLNDADPQGEYSGLQYSDPNNPSADYGRCGQNQDVRNIFNTSMVLKSAFPLHGVVGYLVNNWQVAPQVRLTSGTAINVSEGQDESFTANGGDRPNRVPGVSVYQHTTILSDNTSGKVFYADRSFLNQAAFVLNTVPGTQGNVSRNAYSGPIFLQDDASLSRIFPIFEKYSLDLRADVFNVLNHPSFNNPNSGGTTFVGSTFGEITGQAGNARQLQFAGKFYF